MFRKEPIAQHLGLVHGLHGRAERMAVIFEILQQSLAALTGQSFEIACDLKSAAIQAPLHTPHLEQIRNALLVRYDLQQDFAHRAELDHVDADVALEAGGDAVAELLERHELRARHLVLLAAVARDGREGDEAGDTDNVNQVRGFDGHVRMIGERQRRARSNVVREEFKEVLIQEAWITNCRDLVCGEDELKVGLDEGELDTEGVGRQGEAIAAPLVYGRADGRCRRIAW